MHPNRRRDVAERWIAVIKLRGKLNVECAQKVFDCMVSDTGLLNAIGAAKALEYIQGQPPSSLVTLISQGPGRHIQTHAYDYERTITQEVILIRRIKELQVRTAAAFGTVMLGASVAISNYYGAIMYDLVTGKATTALMWLAPIAVLLAVLFAVYLCASWNLLRSQGLKACRETHSKGCGALLMCCKWFWCCASWRRLCKWCRGGCGCCAKTAPGDLDEEVRRPLTGGSKKAKADHQHV